jgi:hypothetical protein
MKKKRHSTRILQYVQTMSNNIIDKRHLLHEIYQARLFESLSYFIDVLTKKRNRKEMTAY